LGAKRVLWVEALDRAVPGFKKYLVGLGQAGNNQYGFQGVPTTITAYNAAVAGGGFKGHEATYIHPGVELVLGDRLTSSYVRVNKPIDTLPEPLAQLTEPEDVLVRGS
jgi:hypothetical protein